MEFDIGKGINRRDKVDHRARFFGLPYNLERCLRHPVNIELLVNFAAAANSQSQLCRQGVNHRHTHTVQTARDLIGIIVKLSASMEHCHDNFSS